MSAVAWLDHDFAHEHVPDPPGLMRVGTVLDVEVFCLDDLGAGNLPPVSERASGDPGPTDGTPSGPGSSALAVDRRKAQLLEELVDLFLVKPSQFHSYFLGELRRHHVERLADLPVDALRSVVDRAITLYGARGGR